MGMTAREASLKTLAACRKSGAWAETFLGNLARKEGLDRRDTALAARMTYGVLQNTALLDFYIDSVSSVRTGRMEPQVLDVLRLGVYQIVFLDRVPDRAAVSESVELAKSVRPRSAGLVNAVLRRLAGQKDRLPEPGGTLAERLAVLYSHPLWFVAEMMTRLGAAEAEALLRANNAETPMTAQVNTLRTDTAHVLRTLQDEGVQAAAHPWLAHALNLTGTGNLTELRAFQDGLFYIQDAAARLAVTAADIKPGQKVLDACAAPGGKSFSAAMEMGNQGEIVSCDLHDKKRALIMKGAERLGISVIQTRAADARSNSPAYADTFDRVLADVPCSGTGVIRKKPEIRRRGAEDVTALTAVQRDILKNVSRYVKPGGILLYSTCSVLTQENEDVLLAFLKEHPNFAPEAFSTPVGDAPVGMLTLYPHMSGTDGFFIGKLRRRI